MTKNHLFCFGLGYSATPLAAQLLGEGWAVSGTTRDEEKKAKLEATGITTHIFTRETPLPKGALDGVTHILCSIAPDDAGDPMLDMHGDDIAALKSLVWAGLLSTTGVYGDRDGGEVDEGSELSPTNARAEARVAQDKMWKQYGADHGVAVHVLRLAGIYGPGRNPLTRAKAGHASCIVKPGLVLGRIHLDDIMGAVRASMAKPNPGGTYNVTDDMPVPPQDITTYACELLGIEPPDEVPFENAEMSPLMREFYTDCKRVSNLRLKDELGYTLKFPDYKSGLDALNTA
jgi:nucleoside-diphosphate-sugar epimerase